MIIKKYWDSNKGRQELLGFNPKYTYTGYFLLGIIPIYISRNTNY